MRRGRLQEIAGLDHGSANARFGASQLSLRPLDESSLRSCALTALQRSPWT